MNELLYNATRFSSALLGQKRNGSEIKEVSLLTVFFFLLSECFLMLNELGPRPKVEVCSKLYCRCSLHMEERHTKMYSVCVKLYNFISFVLCCVHLAVFDFALLI